MLYSYRCNRCEETTDAYLPMADRHTHAPVCGKNATHGQMSLVIQPVIGYVQRPCHYVCPVTRKQVTTNRQRTNIMAEHNLADANDLPLTPKYIAERQARIDRGKQAAKDLSKPILIHD